MIDSTYLGSLLSARSFSRFELVALAFDLLRLGLSSPARSQGAQRMPNLDDVRRMFHLCTNRKWWTFDRFRSFTDVFRQLEIRLKPE